MPRKKSNAEGMRDFRAKMKLEDPVKYQAYLEKERERYQKRKAAGKIKTIDNASTRDQRLLRRKWKKDKRVQRSKHKKTQEIVNANTPPQSPPPELPESYQRRTGRQKISKENRKAYRTIAKQDDKLKKLENRVRVLNRRIKRLKGNATLNDQVSSTPSSRAQSLINSGNVDQIRKELTFSFALGDELKSKLVDGVKNHKEKRITQRIILGPILKKYRLLDKARNQLEVSKKQLTVANETLNSKPLFQYDRKKRVGLGKTAVLIHDFFLEDRNSTPAAGKRETITRFKDKRQKRYMTDTMVNLYSKFRSEYPFSKASYTSFTRLRPFYVVPPSVTGRDTVKCKQHCNVEMKAHKLHSLGILVSDNSTNLMSAIVCSINDKACMDRSCPKCKETLNRIYRDEDKKSSQETVTYMQWCRKAATRVVKEKVISVTAKVTKSDTIEGLCKSFEEDLIKLMPHQFRIFSQYDAIRTIKRKLNSDECVLQIDFSENYACKATTEIQAMHFGGNRPQVTIHTCHATLMQANSNLATICYATLSEDTRHMPASIWAHLDPVLSDLSQRGIKTVHFVSDGPSSQYKNKTNFQLMALLPFDKWNLKNISWNFLEASHGKGPADGIGAAIKQGADRLVATGTDILSCNDLMTKLKTTMQIHEITTDQINEVEKLIDKLNCEAVKGTMQIHQIVVPSKCSLYHRKLSCFCSDDTTKGRLCDCHPPVTTLNVIDPNAKQIQNKNPVVAAIESKLTKEQIDRFEKRLEDGDDIEILDISSLSPEAQREYAYWKTWRSAILSFEDNEEGSDADCSHSSDRSDRDISDSDDDYCVTSKHEKTESAGSTRQPTNINQHGFYAVFFVTRRKKTFYIGRPTGAKEDEKLGFKFLEKKLIKGKFCYTWPLQDDICFVEKSAVLQEVLFNGPPPFFVDDKTERDLSCSVKNFKV